MKTNPALKPYGFNSSNIKSIHDLKFKTNDAK